MDTVDAVVIGSGPNGLAAAAILARAGWTVTVLERNDVAGGAVRSSPLTAPGYVHDDFSAFYGLLHAAPVFRQLELDRRLRWASFDSPVAAVTAPDSAALVHRTTGETANGLDRLAPGDGRAWMEFDRWWGRVGERVLALLLAPLPSVRPTVRLLTSQSPKRQLDLARMLLGPVSELASNTFASRAAQALLACGITHSDVGVDMPGSVPPTLILALASQRHNMPVPVGGAGRLAEALVAAVEEAGGTVVTGASVTRVAAEGGRAVAVETADGRAVRARRAVLADTGPRRLFADLVDGASIPPSFLDGVRRFRYGSGIFKLDVALDGPVPWAADGLDRCGVVHLCGDLDTMARTAAQIRDGVLPSEPALIAGQQTVADPTRAPAGGHTLWVETHVPPLPRGDAAGAITARPWADISEAFCERVLDRLEHHAPGLRSRIVATAVRTPPDLEAANPNLVDGDLGGGSNVLSQQLVFRPVPGWFRYATPVRGLYLCSASAHPGGGVHGMVGRNCARRVLSDARLRRI